MDISDINKRAIYEGSDGQVIILIPSPNCHLTFEQILDKDLPSGKYYEIVDKDDLPKDYTYYDAWELVKE